MTESLWDVPPSWCWVSISDVGEVVSGGTPSTKDASLWGDEITWFSPADLTGYRQKYIRRGAKSLSRKGLTNSSARVIPSGSVMFSSRAPVGYVAINGIDAATNQGFKSVVPSPVIFNEYLYYYLKASKQLAEERATGTTFKEISGSAFSVLPVALPPLPEQHRIVAKIEALFSELDAGQDSLTRAQAQLRLYRQSLLKSAFQGRLTADWRAANPDKLESPETLLSRIRTERDARYKQALDDWQQALATWRAGGEVGRKPGKPSRPEWPQQFDFGDLTPLPDGWAYLPFEGVAYTIRNGISQRPDDAGTLKIFRISAVRPMVFDLSDFRYLVADDEFDDFRLQQGDLVFTRYNGSRAFVGVAAVYRGDGSHVYPDKLIRCDVASDRLDPGYLEKAVNCGEPRAFIEKRIRTTAGQAGISGADLKAMPVPICVPEEQGELNRILDEKLSQVDAMETEITTALAKIAALRQSILKQAFSGRLVPQDPADEPASALLDRLRDTTPATKVKRGRKASA